MVVLLPDAPLLRPLGAGDFGAVCDPLGRDRRHRNNRKIAGNGDLQPMWPPRSRDALAKLVPSHGRRDAVGVAATAGHSIIWLAQGLKKANLTLTKMRAGAMAFIPSLSGIAVGFAGASETIAGLVAFSPALAGFFTMLSGGFLSVGLAIEATPIGWIITGIAAVAAGA